MSSGVQTDLTWYADWRTTIDLDIVEYGVGGIRLFRPDEVPRGQIATNLIQRLWNRTDTSL